MKAKPKKVKKPSRLDRLILELQDLREIFGIPQGIDVHQALNNLAARLCRLEVPELGSTPELDVRYWQHRFDKAQAAEDAANKLVNEWSAREVAAETELSSTNEKLGHIVIAADEWEKRAHEAENALKHANKTLDQFKREDEARAQTIREIVRPMGFEMFAPMDAVRELAKVAFSLRDELTLLRATQSKFPLHDLAAAEKRASEAEAQLESARTIQKAARDYIARGGAEEKSRLDDRAAQEDGPRPDCRCVRWTDSDTPLTESVTGEIILYGTWGGRTAIAVRKCETCGGTGYRRKPSPSPPDAETIPDLEDSGMSKAAKIAVERLGPDARCWVDKQGHPCAIGLGGVGRSHIIIAAGRTWDETIARFMESAPRSEGSKQASPPDAENKSKHLGQLFPSDNSRCRDATCWCHAPRSEGKPTRLLVEVVAQTDEKHGISATEMKDVKVYCREGRAMSVQELPEMPSLIELLDVYEGTMQSRPGVSKQVGIRAVLAACGLEVSE